MNTINVHLINGEILSFNVELNQKQFEEMEVFGMYGFVGYKIPLSSILYMEFVKN